VDSAVWIHMGQAAGAPFGHPATGAGNVGDHGVRARVAVGQSDLPDLAVRGDMPDPCGEDLGEPDTGRAGVDADWTGAGSGQRVDFGPVAGHDPPDGVGPVITA